MPPPFSSLRPIHHPPRFAFYGGALMVAAAACWFSYNYFMHLWYVEGVAYLDAGFLSGLLHQNDWRLKNPISQNRDLYADTFYSTHVSPFFIPFTYLSHLVPVSSTTFFAFFLSLGSALYAAVVYAAVFLFVADKTPRIRALIAVPFSVVAAFVLSLNGVTVNVLDYHHYEIWLPALICAFLLAWVRGKKRVAALCFILLLSVREDAGIHLSILLLVIAAYRQFVGKWNVGAQKKIFFEQKEIFIWIVVAIVYASIAFSLGGREVHESGVSKSLLVSRLFSIFIRGDWFAVFIVTAVWAWFARTPAVLIGFVSCVPWVVYNATREFWTLGNLTIYYAFPFMVVFVFPFICERFFPEIAKGGARGRVPRKLTSRAAMLIVLSFVVASLVLRPGSTTNEKYGDEGAWREIGVIDFFTYGASPPPSKTKNRILQVKDFYLKNKEKLNIVAGETMTALTPNETPVARRLINQEPYNELKQSGMDILIADDITFAFRANVVAAIAASNLRHAYGVKDIGYVIFSKKPLCDENGKCVDDLPLNAAALPLDFQRLAADVIGKNGFIFSGAALATPNAVVEGDVLVAEREGVAAELNDLLLAPGNMAFFIDYVRDTAAGEPPQLQLHIKKDGEEYAAPALRLDLPPTTGEERQHIPFSLSDYSRVRVRLIHSGGNLRARRFFLYPISP